MRTIGVLYTLTKNGAKKPFLRKKSFTKEIEQKAVILYTMKKIFGRLINRAMNLTPINVIKERVKHLFTNRIHQWVFKSYSQYCEDLIIDCLVNNKQFGVYLDVGANDPNVFSNTKRFYQRGWSGVNIEPDTKLYAKLCRYRPHDINVNIGIGSMKGERTFYEMSADTISTFSEEEVHRFQREGYELVSTQKIPVLPLTDIFTRYLADKHVDFMSVDVEGLELEVLKSNDWSRFRPSLAIVEINRGGNEIITFLKECGYLLVYTNHTNGIFWDQHSMKCYEEIK